MDGLSENWVRERAVFTKSSFSEGGDCVEVARTECVGVRSSHDPNGPVLRFAWAEWTVFAGGMLAGGVDRIGVGDSAEPWPV